MKKQVIFSMTVAIMALTGCTNESEELKVKSEELSEVTLTFSPYDISPMTRSAASIAGVVTRLDVWLMDDRSTTTVHQASTDAGFGTILVPLNRLKTYTMVAVAHKASGAATLTDGVISFPDNKVTHAMICKRTFSPATTTNLNCLMQRIVGMLRFEIADQVPDGAHTMRFSLGESFTQWDATNSVGTNAIERTSTFNDFSRAQDGTAAFTVYVMPSNLTDTDHMDITVTALTEGGDEIESKTFEDVPIKAGYKTTYHGQFFTTSSTSAAFTVESDWSTFDVVEY